MKRTAGVLLSLLLVAFLKIGAARAAAAPASSRIPMRFHFPTGDRQLVRLPEDHLLISAECLKNTPPTCVAFRILPRLSVQEARSEMGHGTNPGAVVCRKAGGKIVVGLNDAGNENSFCGFSDGSLISNGSVYHRARENDRKKP